MTTWLLISAGVPAAALVALVFSPWGAAALALLANSKLARAAAIGVAIAWALLVGAARVRKSGHDAALAEVERANAAAKADRERIERDVAARSDDEVTRSWRGGRDENVHDRGRAGRARPRGARRPAATSAPSRRRSAQRWRRSPP